jgi:hypothetical protein
MLILQQGGCSLRILNQRLFGMVAASVAVLTCGAGAAQAQTILFDFEDFPATWNNPGPPTTPGTGPNSRQGTYGTFNPLVYTKDGLTVTITRFLTVGFDLVYNVNRTGPGLSGANLQGDKPATWGNKSLDPFVNITSDPTPPALNQPNDTLPGSQPSAYWLFSFSQAVSAVSIEFGDYGDDTDEARLRAFSTTNQANPPIATGSAIAPLHSDAQLLAFTVGLSSPEQNIRLVTFESISDGGSATNNVFLDNLRVSLAPAPEPGTVALWTPGALGGIEWARRRFKRQG